MSIKSVDPILCSLLALCGHAVLAKSASGSVAVGLVALSGLYGYLKFLKHEKEAAAVAKAEEVVNIREEFAGEIAELTKEISEAKSGINALKIGRSFGKA